MYREFNTLKKAIMVVLLVLIALFAVSCGKDTGGNTPSPETNSESVYVESEDDDHEYDGENYEDFDDLADIGEEKVIGIALKQVEGATRDDIREAKKEIENGRYVYEFEILYNGLEYEIEIDGGTGNIISLEIDD